MKEEIKNRLISISLFIGIILAILLIPNQVSAMGTWQGNMPSISYNTITGLFPQILQERTITLPSTRILSNTTNWKANISTGTVYCADQGKILRFGKFDYNTYYYTKDLGAGITYQEVMNALISRAENEMKEQFENMYNVRNVSVKGREDSNLPDKFNRNAYAFIKSEYGDLTENNIWYSSRIMQKIMGILDGSEKVPPLSEDIDSVKTYQEWDGDPNFGPKVAVMENGKQTQDGYETKETGIWSSNGDKKEKQAAYILTALEDVYGNKDYSKKYNEEDIQTAYWMLVDPEGQDSLKQNKLTQNGKELYKKSEEYAQFTSDIAEGYKASIDASNAQVIVDRSSKEYIVGPLISKYPDYKDISYIKSMYLTTNTGVTLIVDEQHNDFEIIMAGGTEIPGSNGITKSYPKNGEIFFIKFSATKTNYPTSIDIGAKFEYISNCMIEYEQLGTNAHIYQYMGYNQEDGEFAMLKGNYLIMVAVNYEHWEKVKDHTDDCASHTEGMDCDCSGEYDWVDKNANMRVYGGNVYQPYVEMSDEYTDDIAQPLTAALDGEREYKIETRTVSMSLGHSIDLTMELGGYVWVDEDGGKESVSDGIHNNETKVPNVPVTLYRQDGTQIGTTKTNSNGEYRFSGLNAMYQYYVKFTYNGQYYQPTTFADSSTWGSSSWQNNSNAKDVRNERLAYNLKFESIGSSPENYKGSAGYNETFTKQELLGYTLQTDGTYKNTREAVIDEFGNLILSSSSDTTTKKMIQYVKDCMMDAYTTADGAAGLYPVPSLFVIDTVQYPSMLTPNAEPLYQNAYYINLGLDQREESDLAIKKDVDHVTLEINGQTHTYTYDTLENKENAENEWNISVRLSDAYYNAAYSRELYKSDYIYKASMYGENFADYGKSKEDELEVYITYKIMVRNQATSIRARIDELVDYYDQDLEYIDEHSYIEIKQSREDAAQKGIYSVKASNASRYSTNTMTKIDGYDNLYITGLSTLSSNPNNNYLAAGQTAYVYLTFKVKKDTIDGEDWVRLDEEIVSGNAIGVGKENIVEVNGYSTQYAKGTKVPNVGDVSFTPAGIVDRDSNSGNLNSSDVPKDGTIKYENFEDDTDKAPNIRIILYRDDDTTRVISGSVWEDERTELIEATTTGDGIRANNETLINGVTVQLVELMDNGTEYVWREFGAEATSLGQEIGGVNTIGKGTGSGTVETETPIINYKNLVQNYTFENNHDGTYAFKSFMPGKYVVRFIYGDTVRTVTPSSLEMGGLNEKSYNGQDYKSTTYQEGITQNKTYTWRENSTWNLGQETLGKILTEVTTFKQDASNNETANAKLDAQNQKGYLYDITTSDKITNVSDAKDIESRRNEVVDYSDTDVTNYIAEVLASHKVDYTTMNDRTQLLNDLMTNTKMTAETGMMVIELEYDTTGTDGNKKDNQYKIQNVDLGLEERPKAQLAIDKEVTNVKLTLADGSILFDAKATASNVLWRDHKAYSVGYKGNFMDEDKFGSIVNIRNKNASKFGLIQLTMDEELMHGATVEITYQVTVSNVGEVDYKDNLFYYTGNKGANAKVVTTKANEVIDYVANNLQFNGSNNSNWKVISQDEIKEQGLVNTKLDSQLEKYNTIIVTESLSKDLVPSLYKDKVDKNAQDTVSVPLVLTQLITSENSSDDLSYRNLVEIVKTSNTVGRRMEYSVVGNQDPTQTPQELDSDIAEVVRILPPFGNAGIYYIITAIVLVAIGIVVIGIIFIKKKVLKR